MPKIVRLTPISLVKPDEPPQVAKDGTTLKPVPYEAADVAFDDGIVVQVERPLTKGKVRVAHRDAVKAQRVTIDGVSTGTVV